MFTRSAKNTLLVQQAHAVEAGNAAAHAIRCRISDCEFFGSSPMFMCSKHASLEISDRKINDVTRAKNAVRCEFNKLRAAGYVSAGVRRVDTDDTHVSYFMRVVSKRISFREMAYLLVETHTELMNGEQSVVALFSSDAVLSLFDVALASASRVGDDTDRVWIGRITDVLTRLCYIPWRLIANPRFSDSVCYLGNMGESPFVHPQHRAELFFQWAFLKYDRSPFGGTWY